MLGSGCRENFAVAFDMDNLVHEKQIRTHAVAQGLSLDNTQIHHLYSQLNKLFEIKNRVYYREMDAFLEELNSWPTESWIFKGVRVKLSQSTMPQAELKLLDPAGESVKLSSQGNTSLEAICNAISEITNIRIFLLDFSYTNVVPGVNSLGVASVKLKYHNHDVQTKAYSVDFIEAVTKALLLGVNIIKEKYA